MIHIRNGETVKVLSFVVTVLLQFNSFSQKNATIVDTSRQGTTTVIAGTEYKKGWLGRKLWGDHYRKEWTTPVNVKKITLDTVFGGLKPVEKGGGRQTKNLRL